MKTNVKKINSRLLSLILTIMMLVSIVPMSGMTVNASAVGADAVKNTINSIKSEYPNGSYFSKNGKRCEHGSIFRAYADGTICHNCELHPILKSKGISTANYSNGWTCYSFASYCFTKCFGKPMAAANYTVVSSANLSGKTNAQKYDFFKKAKIGDILRTSGHYMVFISCDSEGVTVYDSNVGGIYYCIQGHKRCTKHLKNGNIGDQSKGGYTGSVRYGKMKYSSVTYTSIKIWHAKNYDSATSSTEKILTIKFNSNGGVIKSDRFKLVSNMVYEGSKLLESEWVYDKPDPVYGLWNAESFGLYRMGYTFVGWGTTPSGGKIFDQDDTSVKPSDMSPNIKNGSCTITLYAIWKPITGSFNYNANGGSGNASAFNVTFGNNFSVSNNSCKRSGYKLVGWNVKRNGDSTWFVGGSAGWVNDSTIKQKGYTKKLYANGSSWTFEDSWVRKDAKSESYTFYAVWEYVPTKAPKLDKKSISLKYKDSDTISVTNDVKVTWESSNSSVVSVDQYGNITAKKKGNATIIATSSDGLTAECQITVRMEWWQTLLKIISFGIY